MMQLVFAATILLSAALMFIVELMFAKMVLPRLGGSPSVWNTCLVFYQAALMAGYIYAHLSLKWLGPRRQSVLHVVLLCTAFIVLADRLDRVARCAAGRGQPDSLALAAADGLRGTAVLLHFGQRAAVAGLVCLLRRALGERPLFPLRGQQSRQPCRPGGLSAADRAPPVARLAEAMVVRRLRAAHGAVRTLCGGGVDRREGAGERSRDRPSRRPRRGPPARKRRTIRFPRVSVRRSRCSAASGGWRWPWCPRRC